MFLIVVVISQLVYGNLVYFSPLHQEKSGNPGWKEKGENSKETKGESVFKVLSHFKCQMSRTRISISGATANQMHPRASETDKKFAIKAFNI
jgi:hypothetical protein